VVERRLRSGIQLGFLLLAACAAGVRQPEATPVPWAIAIHGGAGTIPRDRPAAEQQEYLAALEAALRQGCDRLARGDAAVDVCEAAVVAMLEDDPHFNAGKGAVFNEKGEHELDASIMDGSTLQCGAVAGVRTVKNPISLARLVMEKTRHVLLMGDGAEQFATLHGRRARAQHLLRHRGTPARARRGAARTRARNRPKGAFLVPKPATRPTARSAAWCATSSGRLAAATSTGGLTGKRWGRVGDSPVIGAGNYADGTAAVSGTGTGEQFLRHVVGAHDRRAHAVRRRDARAGGRCGGVPTRCSPTTAA
jgi:beta-aspartyl-peptidase (threonine type)